jgi:hypothetical protein
MLIVSVRAGAADGSIFSAEGASAGPEKTGGSGIKRRNQNYG